MKEICDHEFKSIAGGCGEHAEVIEVNEVCKTIFELSITETEQRLSPFWGLLLMSQHCTNDEVNALVAGYEQTHG